MNIIKFLSVALLFVSTNSSAMNIKDIVDKINSSEPKTFITRQTVFNDPEMDKEVIKSGEYRIMVTFISNGFHYTIWDYDSFNGNDEFLVMYKPKDDNDKGFSSIFSIDEVSGEIIDIIDPKKDVLIYSNYTESNETIDNAQKLVEFHLSNIRFFLNKGLSTKKPL